MLSNRKQNRHFKYFFRDTPNRHTWFQALTIKDLKSKKALPDEIFASEHSAGLFAVS
jgi:hypothetical protein